MKYIWYNRAALKYALKRNFFFLLLFDPFGKYSRRNLEINTKLSAISAIIVAAPVVVVFLFYKNK